MSRGRDRDREPTLFEALVREASAPAARENRIG
jgi:hypothetical protein